MGFWALFAWAYPPIPEYEIAAQVMCDDDEAILHYLHVKKEGNQEVPHTKLMYCIARGGDHVLAITCSYETKSCSRPVRARKTVEEFRRRIREIRESRDDVLT